MFYQSNLCQEGNHSIRFKFLIAYENVIRSDFSENMLWPCTDLKVAGFVVVRAENPEEFRLSPHSETLHVGHSGHECVSSKLLHLDVVKLAEVAEPLDELGGDAACELRASQEDG